MAHSWRRTTCIDECVGVSRKVGRYDHLQNKKKQQVWDQGFRRSFSFHLCVILRSRVLRVLYRVMQGIQSGCEEGDYMRCILRGTIVNRTKYCKEK